MTAPWFDPLQSYDENYDAGPGASLLSAKTETVGGLPFGIPAGPLLNGAYVKAALDAGFDIPVYKTVRTRAYACHPWPNVVPVELQGDLTLERAKTPLIEADSFKDPLSITNSFGVPSKGPDIWQSDMADAVRHARDGQIVVGSFQGTKWDGYSSKDYTKDWATAARLVAETKAPELEANLGCPNEGTAHLLCFDTVRSQEIVHAIKSAVGDVPLTVKIAYFEDGPLREFVQAIGPMVRGIAAINTIPAPIVDAEGNQALPGEGRKNAGVCGAGIRWAGLSMVRRLKVLREELNLSYEITGVGGVMAPEDFFEYVDAGADRVKSATGAMWRPTLAAEIRLELQKRA